MYRGAVASSIRGARGQQLLRELAEALDAMPQKRLIANELELEESGEVCALGALGVKRGMNLSELDPYDYEGVAKAFGVAPALVREIAFENDEGWNQTPEKRWEYMRKWVADQIKEAPKCLT